ncbi:transcriptional regulator, LuxR family [Thioalkalivibrio sp. K90mix]|uniref:response regulator transcription factor n=1 Tax=unclassified Thioalkalivibrio TaxID=2621013 RepID=UPI000195AA4E|nr:MULTISPECIES: response regulator transcription factor [unclassified Thioalkalivibrio]ADC71822.1 transcriptional regulator, LuxR family [Thioalkalivibrio sp. K90mix]
MQIFMMDRASRPSSRWVEAFPDAQVLRPPFPSTLPEGTEACWIGTDLADWEEYVKQRTLVHRVIVQSRHPNDEEGIRAFDAGAHGYCHTLANVAQLRTIAATVTGGGLWVGPDLMTRMIRTVRSAQPRDPETPPEGFENLTPREREVALAVTTGAHNKEIARQLGMTERTVKMHLGSVFKKLNVDDRVQLVLHLTRLRESHPTV